MGGQFNQQVEVFMSLSEFLEIGTKEDLLQCYHCKGEFTHVRGFLWFRRDEDCDHSKTIFADKSSVSELKTSNALNPSARRDGIRVIYDCENCRKFSSLNIWQHKGLTYLNVQSCPDEILQKSFCAKSAEWELAVYD